MGQRLLLVDSDRSFLKEHQVSLESAFDLEVAPSPEGVVPHLEGGDFAAVLICVEVAENKGYALCSSIRKQASLAGIRVALISAKATEEEYRRHQSLKGRADLYLHKPIAPSALVAALAPLVPGRNLDPDNPLGELVDTEIGDDWLDGLKGVLDDPIPAPPSVPALPPPLSEALRQTAPAGGEPVRLRLLEQEIANLRAELEGRDQRLRTAESEVLELRRQAQATTLNLDELERGNREIERLRARAAQAEEALHAADLAGREAAFAGLRRELEAKQQELDEARRAQAQLDATLEGLAERHGALEGLHQSALLEVAGFKEKAHVLQLEVAGLEATMRGQVRDLAELGERLRQVEADLEASQQRVLEREQQAAARQGEVEQRQEEIVRLTAQLAALRQELDEAAIQHEGERLELMNGLDHKEAELVRAAEAQAAQQEAIAGLEREKQALHGQLAEHRDRLTSLDALLSDLQDRARRGSELARG